MKKILLILFFSTLFAQNNLTGSIKLSKSESGNWSEFGLEAKNAITYDVMYNHYIAKNTFLGIGYSMESLTYDDLSSEIFDEADTVDYHGLALELNQELINKMNIKVELRFCPIWIKTVKVQRNSKP